MDERLDLLTGDEAAELLSVAVGSAGGDLVSWRANEVDHRPGSSTTVAYTATVRWGERVQRETLAASSGVGDFAAPPMGAVVVGDGERQVAVWRFPTDPSLPALAAACDAASVARMLVSLGVPVDQADPSSIALRVRGYRPRRRAVIEVRGPAVRVFVKVVRPNAVADLHRRHQLLTQAGLPVPRPLGWSEDGLLVLEARPGTHMRHSLRRGLPLPSGHDLMALLDGLPEEVMSLPLRAPWAANAGHYARVVGSALPAERERSAQLASRIEQSLGHEPDAPTHGDFHEAQVMVSQGAICGLLDVDTVGPGRRADDVACLLGHLETLRVCTPDQTRLVEVCREWQQAAESALDPRELRMRTAGVLLSLATGPHRVQELGWPRATTLRLDAVEQWVESAEAL